MKSSFLSRKFARQWFEKAPLMVVGAMTAALVACGGGGAGESVTGETESPKGAQVNEAQGAAVVAIDPLTDSNGTFYFRLDGTRSIGEIARALTGGEITARWNLKSASLALNPGMKVTFFGRPDGCPEDAKDATMGMASDEELKRVASIADVTADPERTIERWTPMSISGECDVRSDGRKGPGVVFVKQGGESGEVGLYTHTGPQNDQSEPFLGTWGSDGVNDIGSNKNITGTFVGFRMPWAKENAIRPWGSSSATARMATIQKMGAYQIANDSDKTNQAKQVFIVSVINKACQTNRANVIGPCQIQYIFSTAIVQSKVYDWADFSPDTQGRIWFDIVQGSTPIVAGQIPTKGRDVVDVESGLSLYTSAGGATMHQASDYQNFDVRISFEQLKNIVRIIAARRLNASENELTGDNIGAVWGDAWNDPAQWVLVSATVGQEISNPLSDSRAVWIGGGLKAMYVAGM